MTGAHDNAGREGRPGCSARVASTHFAQRGEGLASAGPARTDAASHPFARAPVARAPATAGPAHPSAPAARARAAVLALVLLAAGLPSRAQEAVNDYPTEARADYVFACMAANGQTQEALRRCSCSIDAIAAILPYERYVEAETVLRMRLATGEGAALFRGTAPTTALVAELRRAQAEAEITCF